jgi:hypothetical protein
MAVKTGVVEAIKDGKRLKMDDGWYSSFNSVGDVSIGDTVSFAWVKDKTGQYNNIKGDVNVVSKASAGASVGSSGGGSSSTISATQLSTIRQNALRHATALVVATGVKDVWSAKDVVIELAKHFASFSATGDDLVEAPGETPDDAF